MKKVSMLMIVAIIAMFLCVAAGADSTHAVCVVHKGECLWIRDAPSKSGSKIDSLRWGVECEITEIVDGYAHITAPYHESGWADISYFDIPITETIYTVISDGPLNKRETPDGRYLTRIKSGARVSVLGWRYSKSGELWAKCYKGGYVKASYLAEAE
ncbi:MAG: hypothetical protein IJ719_08320 [Clostridia bacterium]|nr:hypothetical protein [Clostridia bacterium]